MADWEVRRRHVLANVQRVMGPFPSQLRRVPLDVKVIEEKRVGNLIRRKLSFQSDPDDRVPAYLFLPATPPERKLPAVLCLHQTTAAGKDEVAGIRGNADLKSAARLTDVTTGWFDAGVTEDGKNKLVPSITFRLKNSASQPLGSVQQLFQFGRSRRQSRLGRISSIDFNRYRHRGTFCTADKHAKALCQFQRINRVYRRE